MTLNYYKVLFYISVYSLGAAVSLNLQLDKCHLEDDECMVKAFRKAIPTFSKGLPEYGIEVMDVMELNDPIELGTSGLSLRITNGRLKGVKDIVINTVKWDKGKKKLYLEYLAPIYSLSGQYVADGQISILPIKGDGDLKIKIKNLTLNLTLFLDEYKKDGQTHVSIKNYEYNFKIEGYAKYDLKNLFNGNKVLSDPVLKFLNENWEVVTNELGRPIMDAVAKKIFKNVNRFLTHESMEELSLSY